MRPNHFRRDAGWIRLLWLEALWLALHHAAPFLVSARGSRVLRGGGVFRCR